MPLPRLITMAHSHYCERARWALERVGLDYVEERHLPLLHRLHTTRVGGGSVPVLVDGPLTVLDSASILQYAARVGHRVALYPTAPALNADVAALERHFDRELGPHARRWAYGELLGSVALLNRCVSAGVPGYERAMLPAVMLFARPLIRRGFRITPESAARSLERVRVVFDDLSARLADGRPFLVGDDLGAADITFASLAAPVLLPPEFGGALPMLGEVPAAMAAEVARLRATPAGAFALRIYRLARNCAGRESAPSVGI
jgi:glutathione S-transferase